MRHADQAMLNIVVALAGDVPGAIHASFVVAPPEGEQNTRRIVQAMQRAADNTQPAMATRRAADKTQPAVATAWVAR